MGFQAILQSSSHKPSAGSSSCRVQWKLRLLKIPPKMFCVCTYVVSTHILKERMLKTRVITEALDQHYSAYVAYISTILHRGVRSTLNRADSPQGKWKMGFKSFHCLCLQKCVNVCDDYIPLYIFLLSQTLISWNLFVRLPMSLESQQVQ